MGVFRRRSFGGRKDALALKCPAVGDAIDGKFNCVDLDDNCDDGDDDNDEGDADKDSDSSGEVVNANLIHAKTQFCH